MEFLKLNEHPVEQAALRHLVALREPLLCSALYTLQLMAAIWERGEVAFIQGEDELPEQVNLMIGWDQDNAAWLLYGDEDLDSLADDPQAAAIMLYDWLHWRLLEVAPGYGTPHD